VIVRNLPSKLWVEAEPTFTLGNRHLHVFQPLRTRLLLGMERSFHSLRDCSVIPHFYDFCPFSLAPELHSYR
jgi:hypothetical protein